jgi:tetratricopeptide (TPR) repeat protein
MNDAGNNDVDKIRFRIKIYFVAAYVFMFLGSLFSSLDVSFLYIFFGAAVFFIFLALQKRLLASADFSSGNYRASWQKAPSPSIFDILSSIFKQKPSAGVPTSGVTQQRIMIIAVAVISSFFVMIFSIVLLVDNSSSNEEFPQYYMQQGDNYYSAGNMDSAYLSYKSAISINPDLPEAYYGIANIKVDADAFDSALYYYDKALSLDPSNMEAVYGKAWVFYNEEKHRNSLQELQYIFKNSDEPVAGAYLLAGDNYYVQKMYDSAMLFYEPAYRNGTRSKELLNIMAYIYDVKGETQKAIAFYQETLQYDSEMKDVNQRLGELLPGEEGAIYRAKASAP